MPQERVTGADYEVSLSVTLADNPLACEKDCLDGTINYATLADIVQREMDQPANLLEHVAWRIAHTVKQLDMVQQVTVSVTKVNPPLGIACNGATVQITL